MKRWLPSVLVAGVVLAAGAMALLPRPAAKPDGWRPRLVVLVSIDTCRADHLGCYGYKRPTSPFLDRIAADGTLFENAFSQSNESLFSYASIMTGRYARQVSSLSHAAFQVPESVDTLALDLEGYGVKTSGYVAGGHLNHRFGTGNGFGTWADQWNFGSFQNTIPPTLRHLSTIADRLANGPTGRDYPAFVFVQGYDLHEPYLKPGPFRDLYDPGYAGAADEIVSVPNALERVYRDRWFERYPKGELAKHMLKTPDILDRLTMLEPLYTQQRPARTLTPTDTQHLIAAYDSAISYADVWLGLLMAQIRELGLEDQTLLIVIGDHGEELGEHGYYGHRMFLDDASLHVPLVLWGPGGVPRGKRIRDVVELRELKDTVADYLGLPTAKPSAGLRRRIEGHLDGADSSGSAISEGIAPPLTIRTAHWRLTYTGGAASGRSVLDSLAQAPLDDTHFALYDLEHDGGETKNLVNTDTGARTAESLRARILLRMREAEGATGRPSPPPETHP